MLEINGLNVFYGDYQALFDIQATVASGEIVSLLGANGAGKSTTIKTDRTRRRSNKPADRINGRRLAGTIGA